MPLKIIYDNPFKTILFAWVLGGIAEDIADTVANGPTRGWVFQEPSRKPPKKKLKKAAKK